jgi:hypothetical protein
MTAPTPLSPAAQAVWDAYKSGGLETALIAAADQVVPEDLKEPRGTGFRWGGWAAKQGVRRRLLALAAALAQPEPEGDQVRCMVNCHWDGPPPSPHASVSDWFEQEGSKGILYGLRISALPSRNEVPHHALPLPGAEDGHP